MSAYVRPAIKERTFVIEAGDVNTYSHQERFLPIFTVADALVDYIVGTYDATVDLVEAMPEHAALTGSSYSRILRITPARADQAPLTIGFGEEPGVLTLSAGFFSQFDLWFCGCDACDDRWQDVADSLEDAVLKVVNGDLTEKISKLGRGRVRYGLTRGRYSPLYGSDWVGDRPQEERAAWARILKTLPRARWAAYSPRE